jgi:hypothetical protein
LYGRGAAGRQHHYGPRFPGGEMSRDLIARIRSLDLGGELAPGERDSFLRLLELFAALPPAPDPGGHFPRQDRLRERFLRSIEEGDAERVEEAFLELYCLLHMHEAPYTPEERRRMDETGGYWCHAGGLSPLLKAGPWIGPETVLADFGAGNGLQGLLFQKLHPHARTVQVEISSRMIAIGKELQEWLGIERDRVEWICDDVCSRTPEGIDFIYLYRPVRPDGEGRAFYERFAAALAGTDRPVVIFSIADCLHPFLPEGFEEFYGDGHLTCYRRK